MSNQKGFTLIELMIVVAIVAILAGIAVPEYNKYVVKARQAEYINAANSFKVGLGVCYNMNDSFQGCDTNELLPPTEASGNIQSTAVNATTGVVTITMTASSGGSTYDLTPSVTTNGVITWTGTSKCTTNKDLCFGKASHTHEL